MLEPCSPFCCAQANWLPLVLICEGPQRVRDDALRMPMPTHKALTKLEPLRRPAPSAANGGEPAFKSTWAFDFQPTCICLKSHEENVLPTLCSRHWCTVLRAEHRQRRDELADAPNQQRHDPARPAHHL